MKKLLTALALAVSLAAPTQAQEPEMLVFPMGIPCTPPAPEIYDNFEDNMGELPMLRGNIIVGSLNGGEYDATMELFVNPDNANFSIVIYFEDDEMACILTVGKELTPFIQGDQI